MASFVSSTQRGIRRCLASGWSDTGSVLSVEASTLKSADLQRKYSTSKRHLDVDTVRRYHYTNHLRMVAMGDPLDLSYPKLMESVHNYFP